MAGQQPTSQQFFQEIIFFQLFYSWSTVNSPATTASQLIITFLQTTLETLSRQLQLMATQELVSLDKALHGR